MQALMRIDKDASGHVTQHELMGVQYVPLIHTGKQPPAAATTAGGQGSMPSGGARPEE